MSLGSIDFQHEKLSSLIIKSNTMTKDKPPTTAFTRHCWKLQSANSWPIKSCVKTPQENKPGGIIFNILLRLYHK